LLLYKEEERKKKKKTHTEARAMCALFLVISQKFNMPCFLVIMVAGELSAMGGTS
jgi:hypothetical protein